MIASMNAKLSELFSARHGVPAQSASTNLYDKPLILVTLALMSIGLIVVTSASMPVAEREYGNPFFFSIRHGIYLVLSLIAAGVVLQIPMRFWRIFNPYLLLFAMGLLLAVLLVGKSINGSTRWIVIGPMTLQPAEPAKLFFFAYLAGYLVRRYEEVTENLKGFFKPLVVLFFVAIMLLMQPDFGTVVVMLTTTMGLLFLAGARLWQFFGVVFVGLAAVVGLIVMEEYRLRRVTSFLDPWADPFGSGYQLTQSLMAYGRGSWFGQGLGNSYQKLEFLTQAHSDFIMAILAEELGFAGVLLILGLILFLVLRALRIGNLALQAGRPFEGYLAYGIGIWLSFQTAVNVGASVGVVPTKGLTLPLVSYGGTSLIVMMVAIALLIRIDFEIRLDGQRAPKKKKAVRRLENKSQPQANSSEQSQSKAQVKTMLEDVQQEAGHD